MDNVLVIVNDCGQIIELLLKLSDLHMDGFDFGLGVFINHTVIMDASDGTVKWGFEFVLLESCLIRLLNAQTNCVSQGLACFSKGESGLGFNEAYKKPELGSP